MRCALTCPWQCLALATFGSDISSTSSGIAIQHDGSLDGLLLSLKHVTFALNRSAGSELENEACNKVCDELLPQAC